MRKPVIDPKLRLIMSSLRTTADLQENLPELLKLIIEEHDELIGTINSLCEIHDANT
jgi:hypothetical protein